MHNDGAVSNENRLGAVRDLHFVLQRIPAPAKALVSAGDNIYRFRLQPLWQQFLNSNASYVIALPETDEAKLQKTGVLTLGNENRVMAFAGKTPAPLLFLELPTVVFPAALRLAQAESIYPGFGSVRCTGFICRFSVSAGNRLCL